MAAPDRPLLNLLKPIFEGHAEAIEAMLPQSLRANWRSAVRFADPVRGRKANDHRELLLAMAEMDTEPGRPPRKLAAAVLAAFPLTAGAGSDDRQHVALPDGSRPARKDLFDVLARQYTQQREALRSDVEQARLMGERTRRHLARIASGTPVTLAIGAPPSPAFARRLRAIDPGQIKPTATAAQVDAVQAAVRQHCKRR